MRGGIDDSGGAVFRTQGGTSGNVVGVKIERNKLTRQERDLILACEVARSGQLVKGYGDVRRRMVAFIDDLLPNIETARGLGFRAHHYHADRHADLLSEVRGTGAI